MKQTIAFVTSQYSCDRIISAARQIADANNSELVVVGIMDNEYEINPEVVDYLFKRSKDKDAIMNLIFREDKIDVMHEVISRYECRYVVSGMPSNNQSVLYDLWKDFANEKDFFTVDINGDILEIANTKARSV